MKQRNFFARAFEALRGSAKLGAYALTGEWEGGETSRFFNRPARNLKTDDETLDIGTRELLISEADDICRKFGLPNRILNKFSTYVVGTCQAQWQTPDREWNQVAEELFWNDSQNIDFKGQRNLQGFAMKAVKNELKHCDFFLEKLQVDGGIAIDGVEAVRVGNYNGGSINTDQDRSNGRPAIVGGVILDAKNRPRGYRVWERAKYGMFTNPRDVPRSDIFHVFDGNRCEGYRPVTAFHPVLNRMRSMKETIQAEQTKQNVASKLALLVRNERGGPRASEENPFEETTTAGNAKPVEHIGEGAIKYQFPGDSLEAFFSNSPGDPWFKLTEFLIRDIAIALDLHVETVWNLSGLTGPAVRAVMKGDDRTFQKKQDMIESKFLNPFAAWWVNWKMQNGQLPFNPLWYQFRFERPPLSSIDAGRDTDNNMKELAAGTITESKIAAESGDDPEEIRTVRLKEVDQKFSDAKALAEKYDISIELAITMLGRPGSGPLPGQASDTVDVQRASEPASAQTLNIRLDESKQKRITKKTVPVKNSRGEVLHFITEETHHA